MANKSKKKVSNIMLVISCIMITLYAAADFALQYFTQIEVSPTLTTAWFSFWGGELACLAGIKITKVIKGTDDTVMDESTLDNTTEPEDER
jgi:hypothetical protein